MMFAMDSLTYTLQQLSDLSGVEPRTIRSYIERDLLPGPRGLGPKASYGPEHLARLEVIRLLRDAHREITLDQIRNFLGQLTPEKIAAIAQGGLKAAGTAGASGAAGIGSFTPPGTSALQYLYSIGAPGPVATMEASPAASPKRRASTPLAPMAPQAPLAPIARMSSQALSEPSLGRTPFEELLGVLGGALGPGTVSRSVRSETWHRVPITPDIELSVRGELDTDKLALLQRIGDHLRHLLMKGTRK